MLKSTWKSATKNHVIYYTMYCKKQKNPQIYNVKKHPKTNIQQIKIQ